MGAPLARDIIESIMARRINYNPWGTYDVRWYGAATDNSLDTDDTGAFKSAMQAAAANGGGIVKFYNWHRIDGPLTISNRVTLSGVNPNVGTNNGSFVGPAFMASALVINPTNTVTLNNTCAVENALIITTALAPGGANALPFADGAAATAAVAAYSGTAFTPSSTNIDSRLENLLVLGFNYLYDGRSAASLLRPLFKRVYGDCINGIAVANVSEIGRAEDCEMWPGFTTGALAPGTPSLSLRSGTAFYTGSQSTWMKWQDCFEYGWAIGHHVDGCENVRQICCGADSPATTTVAHTNVGFQWDGAVAQASAIFCKAAAQGDCGYKLNTSVNNLTNDVKLINCDAQSNGAINGHVHILQGSASLIGNYYANNSSTGHINLDAGLTNILIDSCTFANCGSTNPPIFGDATSVANARVVNAIHAGTTVSNFGRGEPSSQINTQNAAYTTTITDAGMTIYHTDGTARTYTIDSNANVPYAIGTKINFSNDASAAVDITISITTDTMLLSPGGTTGSRTLAQYGYATARKVSSTRWIISGSGLT